MRFKIILLLLAVYWICLPIPAIAGNMPNQNQPTLTEDAPLVIQFKTNASTLDAPAKARLRRMFEGIQLEPNIKILLAGYADNRGRSRNNQNLSLARARSVRDELIKNLGLSQDRILALGQGEQDPVADNKNAQGRSHNRRVEIYFAKVINGSILEALKIGALPLEEITPLIETARNLIRDRQLGQAFHSLDQARALGADRLSDWHTVYGMAGYYAGMAADKIRAHLTRALALDSYNADARAFLGRLDARQKITRGQIPPAAGTRPETALMISHREEIYEYLRLLGIQPRGHATLPQHPIEIWTGVDSEGKEIHCFFNYCRAFDWAFDSASAHRDSVAWRSEISRYPQPITPDQIGSKPLSAPY